ncbi:MAG TPA: sigma-70 family RNA polymerase sigma factor [Gemmatimonadales bacterium]|jgi:RNA polymerase sigma factor (TIGR02999 family)|nr:sigma-70 family RNA polymerase sigma factor [Gemmatimonadales bacterium]
MEGVTPTAPGEESITDLLVRLGGGDRAVEDRLYPLVYEQLRRIAHRRLQSERSGHTLGTTGLVHETYLKLVDQTRVEWRDRAQFYALAARAMRRILVDYARRYGALRRGGGLRPITLSEDTSLTERADHLVALDEALDRLAAMNARLSQVVQYRYFVGLTEEETAELLGVTVRTVQRDWAKARGWLSLELRPT